MSPRTTPRRHPVRISFRGMTLGEWLLVLFSTGFLLFVAVSFFFPARRVVRPAALQTMCRNHLRQISLALNAYTAAHGTFPPTCTVDAEGRPLHSWRTLLLPYLEPEYKQLYDRIDLSKPWDDPVNAEVFRNRVLPFQCPALFAKNQETTYLAVRMSDNKFHVPDVRTFTERAAGPPESLIIVEVDLAHAVPWMTPQDADAELFLGIDKHAKISHPRGTHGLFANGRVELFPTRMSVEERQTILSRGMSPSAVRPVKKE